MKLTESTNPSVPQTWRHEPLLHFLMLGAALFALNAWLDQRSPAQGSIILNEAHVRALAENFRRTWQRVPSAQELDGLIEEQIRDEVLTREAQRLGLDRDDTVIRRRLRQKIEIITEEAAASVAPTQTQLQTYLAANADAFRGEARIAFAQVYLDANKRGKRLDADANGLLEQLNAPNRRLTSADISALGDRLFVLKPHYPLAGQREIATTFGSEFAAALPNLPHGRWQGPVTSGYGVHLVRVDEIIAAPLPTLADVRPLVEREWRNVQRKEAAQAQYQRLRDGYKIVVKKPAAPERSQ